MDTPYENARASTFHTSTPSNRARRRRALGDDDDEHSPRNHVHELHHIPSTNNLRRHPPHHGRGVRRAIHPDDDRASRRRPRPRRSLTLARVSARAPFATRAVARAQRARTVHHRSLAHASLNDDRGTRNANGRARGSIDRSSGSALHHACATTTTRGIEAPPPPTTMCAR